MWRTFHYNPLMRAVGFFVCFALALAGCAPKEVTKLKAAPDPVVPAGWVVHRVDAAGFSLAAPENWVFPKDGVGLDAQTLQNLGNPAAGAGFSSGQESSTAGADLILADRNYRPVVGEPITSITVKRVIKSGGANLTQEADELASEYVRVKSKETLDLPIGKIVEIEAVQGTKGGDTYRHIDYVLVNGEEVFTVRLVSAQSLEAIKTIARPVIETFRVHKPAP